MCVSLCVCVRANVVSALSESTLCINSSLALMYHVDSSMKFSVRARMDVPATLRSCIACQELSSVRACHRKSI